MYEAMNTCIRLASCADVSHFKVVWSEILVFNSSSPSAAYMCRWAGSTLVQKMDCCLFGAKPIPEPMLAYCQLDSSEQISVKLELEFYIFHSRKRIWKCHLPDWQPFCSGGNKAKEHFINMLQSITLVTPTGYIGYMYNILFYKGRKCI